MRANGQLYASVPWQPYMPPIGDDKIGTPGFGGGPEI